VKRTLRNTIDDRERGKEKREQEEKRKKERLTALGKAN
jgi:hypothetical protein